MITLHDTGGRMGNFLYLCACLQALAWKNNVECGFQDSAMMKYFPKLQAKKIPDSYRVSTFYSENGAGYQDIPFTDGMCIVGFWQSFKYYDEYLEGIRDLFLPDKTHSYWKACSIHIRRGDYLDYPDKHPVIDKPYLEQAIEVMNKKGIKYFFVFSDDPAWCKDNLTYKQYPGNHFSMFSHENSDPYTDLLNMSYCSHNIISNSTYAIWAAELNRNPDKIVITPHEDNYYGPSHKSQDVKDLLRPEWIKIKY